VAAPLLEPHLDMHLAVWCLGFGVWCLVFGVWSLGFGVWGLGFGVWGLWFGVRGSEFGVRGSGFGVWAPKLRSDQSGIAGVEASGNAGMALHPDHELRPRY